MSEAISFSSDSVKDLAAEFSSKASAKTSSKKPAEWVLRLDDTTSACLKNYCESQAILSPVETYSDSCKKIVTEACYEAYVVKFWTEKTRPANPHVQSLNVDGSVDCDLIYILQDKFKINIDGPTDDDQYTEEWAKEAAIAALQSAGLSAAKAKKFVEQEIECVVTTHFLTLQEMIEGTTGSGRKKVLATATTKSAGHKLMKFMLAKGTSDLEPFTQQELAAITYKKVEWIPKAGMLDRVCSYCKSIDDLKIIFKVLQPVTSIRSNEFGISDSDAIKSDRLTKTFNKVVLKK